MSLLTGDALGAIIFKAGQRAAQWKWQAIHYGCGCSIEFMALLCCPLHGLAAVRPIDADITANALDHLLPPDRD